MYLHAHSVTRTVAGAADLPVLRHFLPAAVLLVPHVLARLVELDVTSTPSSSTLHPRASATTAAAVHPATTATAAVYPAASTATVDPASTTSIDPASTASVNPAASTLTAATPVKQQQLNLHVRQLLLLREE